MRSFFRKLNLTAHVATSVGWLGAVVTFLALSIAGLTSSDAEVVRGAYLAMNLIGAFIIVPLSLLALLSGLVQALGTHWGLFQHYWVLVKLTLTIGAATLLLLHQFTAVASAARRVSATAPGTLPDVGSLGPQLVGDAGLAVLVLLVTTTLSIYKPWGRTAFARRNLDGQGHSPTGTSKFSPLTSRRALSTRVKLFFAIIALLVAIIIVHHLSGGGLGSHSH